MTEVERAAALRPGVVVLRTAIYTSEMVYAVWIEREDDTEVYWSRTVKRPASAENHHAIVEQTEAANRALAMMGERHP